MVNPSTDPVPFASLEPPPIIVVGVIADEGLRASGACGRSLAMAIGTALSARDFDCQLWTNGPLPAIGDRLIHIDVTDHGADAVERCLTWAFDRGADLVVLISACVRLHPKALAALVAAHDEEPGVLEGSPFLRGLADDCHPGRSGFLKRRHLLAVSRAAYQEIGHPRADLVSAWDVDYRLRALRVGISLRRLPDAWFDHTGPEQASPKALIQACQAHGIEPPPGAADVPPVAPRPAPASSTVSVLVRVHDFAALDCLSRCLFSLSLVEDVTIRVHLLLQSPNPDEVATVGSIAESFSWAGHERCTLHSINAPDGDYRTQLLNVGIEQARDRYLAILDYDDVARPLGYATLVERLQNTEAGIAFGRVFQTKATASGDVLRRDIVFEGQDRFDLFRRNFCPINSYVLDRERIDPNVLRFDESLTRFEDYDFLLRLLASHMADFSCREIAVAEYWLYEDGRNTNPEWCGDEASWRSWREGLEAIEERKQRYLAFIPISEVIAMVFRDPLKPTRYQDPPQA